MGTYRTSGGEVILHLHATLATIMEGGPKVLADHLIRAIIKPRPELFLIKLGEVVAEVLK